MSRSRSVSLITVLTLAALLAPMAGGTAVAAPKGKWSTTGSMTTTRRNHTATLLPNGKVLVAGGCCDNTGYPLSSSELYDPSTGTWSATGSMAEPRDFHTATLLNNGEVLIAGGEASQAIPAATAELYDPSTGAWSPTGSMLAAHVGHTATLLKSGHVLVVGGCCDATGLGLSSAELYDPSTGTWTRTRSMETAREFHSATLLNTGDVLVTGECCTPFTSTPFASAELYDPATGIWSTARSMATARDDHTATLLVNGDVLVAGGSDFPVDALSSAELYTPPH